MTSIQTYYTIEDAFKNTLHDVYHTGVHLPNGDIELINYNFRINNLKTVIDQFNFKNKNIGFNIYRAEKYYEALISGRTNIIGPRIITQLPYIVEELIDYPLSKKAVITILDVEDKELLRDNRSAYPCIISQTFWIRDDKLHSLVHMRSNDVVKKICYDLYNFIHLQNRLLWLLNDIRTNPLILGDYHYNIVNAHIKEKDIELTRNILDEYK